MRKYVYSYINFTAQEYNLMTWTDQRQKCNFKVHILLFLAQISRINVVRKTCLFVQSYTRLMYYCFLNSGLRKICFFYVGNATPWKPSLCCVFKMIMGKYVHLYDFGKTCALIIIFTNASHFAPLNSFI